MRSPVWMTSPERIALSRVGRRDGGQALAGMECGDDVDPLLIRRLRERILWRDEDVAQLLPAAGQGRRARSLWRARMAFLASWGTQGSLGEDMRARHQTHSGQMGPPAKKLEW